MEKESDGGAAAATGTGKKSQTITLTYKLDDELEAFRRRGPPARTAALVNCFSFLSRARRDSFLSFADLSVRLVRYLFDRRL